MSRSFETFVLFGATGDLAQRMLFPSLYNLSCDGLLPAKFRIIASARSAIDTDGFRSQVHVSLQSLELYDADKAATFLDRIEYCAVSSDNPNDFNNLAEKAAPFKDGGIAFYLSTPPGLFAPVVAGLESVNLTGPLTRIAMEKPIGHDLPSSREVNAAVGQSFDEENIFRVDHYLGKETVQNLLVLRFGNTMFEPLWNATSIEHVQITVAETVGLEGRVSYYDGVGALSDMVQNHMLQLLALVAMEPPASYTATAIRDEKVKVLRSLRPLNNGDAATHSVKGQYTAGAIDGQPVVGYADELGGKSNTETFVAVKAHLDNWRWRGVPFYLRTGKRLPTRHSEILIQFRPVPHSIFSPRGTGLEPNALVIRLQPHEGIGLQIMTKEPGLDREGIELANVGLDVSLATTFAGKRRRIAYERLLLDLLEGDTTLFVRRDEIEAAWTWVDSIHTAWKSAGINAKPYTAGSWGPSAAMGMIERDGASWHD
ncbi:glucose-6-phosphate dehydrogenase [Sphingomonas paeninsulae]|uniref:Glucose-6-phosphate 1-dehydrogenase n=1 Tax=Sphingomonas paeninsulae TaxID=2319844 RepID=A0A494TJS5_SPHPE|nr:glucose-6-phosphate dehydrogenase [Sphingomonas paeninsulae]AYJ87273.1 glucose-6-phosphate dehydrogenase [Sphingomonas paeninsulae]